MSSFKRVASLTKNSTPEEIEAQRSKLLARTHPPVVKVLLVGDKGVGKTSIIHRFVDGAYRGIIPSTFSVEFVCKTTAFQGEDVQLRIYDSPGASVFAPLAEASWSHYFAGMHAVAVCFDVSKRSSFDSVPHWLAQAVLHSGTERAAATHRGMAPTVSILVGTKCDVGRAEIPNAGDVPRQVEYDEAVDFARRNGVVYVETRCVEAGQHATHRNSSCYRTLHVPTTSLPSPLESLNPLTM
eukprot:SAG22_NODE_851_length_6849_cov_37.382519_2_plen_240_part_00